MPRYYLLHSDNTYSDAAMYPEQPEARQDGQWVAGQPDGLEPHQEKSLIDTLSNLVTLGQQQLSGENALPADIQKSIYDLEIFLQNYWRRGAVDIMKATVQGFEIDPERHDVTSEQRTTVAALKAQMLSIFPE